MIKQEQAKARSKPVAVKDVEVDVDLLILQLAEAVRASARSAWDGGYAAYQLHGRGFTDAAIVEELAKRGVRVERTTVNMYRLNYDFFVERFGFDREKLEKYSVNALSAIRRVLAPYPNVSKDMVEQVLQRAEDKTAREAEEIAAKAVGKHKDELNQYVSLGIPSAVRERIDEAREYLQGIADASAAPARVTAVTTVEFATELLLAFGREPLLKLWEGMHGEATEDEDEE